MSNDNDNKEFARDLSIDGGISISRSMSRDDGDDDDVVMDPNGYAQDEFLVDNDIVQYSTSARTSDIENDYEHVQG